MENGDGHKLGIGGGSSDVNQPDGGIDFDSDTPLSAPAVCTFEEGCESCQ